VEPKPFLTLKQLAARWGKSKSSIENHVADGTAPKPLKIGGSLRFLVSEVEEAERRMIDARDAAVAP
jgi:predicted DNA-binding transcriptional regulator AlpA